LRISLQPSLRPEPSNSELQTNLEELGKRPVGPIVFVNTCIIFDIVFVDRIEVDKSDLLLDYFKTSGWRAIAHRLSSEEVNVV